MATPQTPNISTGRQIMMTETLRRAPMFADVDPESLRRIVAGSRLQKVDRGDYLFHEAEPADGFYVVHTGAINVHRVTEDGREQVIRVFYPGESLGEVVLVGDQSYPASAKASESSQVILIPTTFFRQCIQSDPDLALRILASMSLHLRYLIEAVESLKLRQAESRVAQWFIRQWDERELKDKAGPSFELPLAKHLLASQLGITSETLSRVFAKLRREKLVDISGKSVHFLSINGLREFLIQAEGSEI